jgi:hypothetical protein
MKRIASNEVVKEGSVKKADVGADAIERLVKEWAKGDEERAGRWIKAISAQDVDDLQALKELCTNEEGWEGMLSDFNKSSETRMLATKLKLWKQSQPISPVAAMQIDREGK